MSIKNCTPLAYTRIGKLRAYLGPKNFIEMEEWLKKRIVANELIDGVAAMKGHREGKLTLRNYKLEVAPLPTVDSKLIRDARKKLRCSRAVFARKLRINERTLEKWEQGRAKPNPQAAALILLVRRYPDTLQRLEALAAERMIQEEGYERARRRALARKPFPKTEGRYLSREEAHDRTRL